ncbi:MAG: hypothetical protein KIT22_04285 [Verrucomicrobiae bacterium]|nr:hypothetical protein [Verrucomicrobiae bacterium]
MNRPPPFEQDAGGPDALERRMAAQPWRPPPPSLRARILAAAAAPAPTDAPAPTRRWRWRWSELLWPGPWAWGTVAACWIAIMAFGFGAEQTARQGVSLARRTPGSPAPIWMGWQEQQARLAALLEEDPPVRKAPAVLQPRSALPGPRLGDRGRRPPSSLPA